jgi:hypothetical protein
MFIVTEPIADLSNIFVTVSVIMYWFPGSRFSGPTTTDSFVLSKFLSKIGDISLEEELIDPHPKDFQGALPRPDRSDASIDIEPQLLMDAGARRNTRGTIGDTGAPITTEAVDANA